MASTRMLVTILLALATATAVTEAGIGVNYGRMADNLPPPSQVAKWLKSSTIIDKVKLFDADPATLEAFANTGIEVIVAVGNGDIPNLRKPDAAKDWVHSNIVPHVPATKIVTISVGNEILQTGDRFLVSQLLPTMQTLHDALVSYGIDKQVKVSTPHSLGILSSSEPPSTGRFRKGYDEIFFKPMLAFLNATGGPFMVNPYPYFGYTDKTLNYALFKPNDGVHDAATGITYTNMFVAQLDAIFSAMKLVGYPDVPILVAETGWPSVGDDTQPAVNVENAQSYNGNLIKFVLSGSGTPLMPHRTFDTYIFSLFNENLKPGPVAERNFGLFKPDLTSVYDVGVMRTQPTTPSPATSPTTPAPVTTPATPSPATTPTTPAPVTTPTTPAPATTPKTPAPSTGAPTNPAPSSSKKWCVAKPDADPTVLQHNIDYVCGQGIDCAPIQDGGSCFTPNTLLAHATFAMNAYYQAAGKQPIDCDFAETGLLVADNPSYGACVYEAN